MNIIPYTDELKTLPPDGAYSGVPNEVYHRSWDAVGRSGLKLMALEGKTPLHIRDAFLRPQDASQSMILGSAVDSLIFDGENHLVRMGPTKTRRSKVWDEFEAANPGMICLTESEHGEVVKMVEALKAHPAASVLLEDPGYTQLSLVWTDTETGCRCKARPDKVCPETGIAIDLKTASCASKPAFAYAMQKYGYALQAAFYSRGLEALGVMKVDHWVDIVVENEPPYGVACYEIGAASIAHALALALPAMHRLAECQRTRHWPGYALDIQPIELPPWALRMEPETITEGE